MRPEQNTTALNAMTEKFITAKISGNALKQGSRTHSVLRQRSSQLQKHSISRDVVLAKKVWERIQKIAIFKAASKTSSNKTWKRCGNAVPMRSRPTTPLSIRLRIITVEQSTLNTTTGQFKTAKTSGRSNVS